ncbi:MAG: 4-hydroxy-3-methylbut-2-enyl diphosphate reductase [Propionibacteriaceae bacterium]|jgi:4-hydroxy-3-methylbut-2-enyl diphosphate reductase|nr:4-hydroxy-3-methylbut-2-enyl diphosphate reductase [Propionibacteriaceae bacterium]
MGKVIVIAPRGYCAGVDRAVATVERALEIHGPGVYVRREIVHNKHVVDSLRAKGAIFVSEVEEIPPGSVVVFSAHGVSPSVRDAAAARGLLTIDATCPLVTKVHKEAKRLANSGMEILLIGHAGHEEVEGTKGEAPDSIRLIERPDDVDAIEVADPSHVAWLSQTTLSVDETREVVARLRDKYPNLADPPSEDICYATSNRQGAVREVAPGCDLMLVVGSANSSNSVRLAEVAEHAGAGMSHLIDDVSRIDPAWLTGVEVVGVTSGASVPEYLVQEVVEYLAEHGYADVEQYRCVEETLTFSLPPQVRG